jgi:hypothetical protein
MWRCFSSEMVINPLTMGGTSPRANKKEGPAMTGEPPIQYRLTT